MHNSAEQTKQTSIVSASPFLTTAKFQTAAPTTDKQTVVTVTQNDVATTQPQNTATNSATNDATHTITAIKITSDAPSTVTSSTQHSDITTQTTLVGTNTLHNTMYTAYGTETTASPTQVTSLETKNTTAEFASAEESSSTAAFVSTENNPTYTITQTPSATLNTTDISDILWDMTSSGQTCRTTCIDIRNVVKFKLILV